MHMNLRRTIRLPQRLQQDQVYTPVSRPRERDDKCKPRYIDFNPNLPPAAFPTLERPRDLGRNGQGLHREGNTEDGHVGTAPRNARSLEDLPLSTNAERQREVSPTAEFDGVSLGQLDNYVASNGDLNPTWVSNMEKMASARADPYGELEMEDKNGNDSQPTPSCRSPNWTDLSYRMQAEIFNNLLERWSYSTVCRMLGLTSNDRKAIETTLRNRRDQAEYEEGQLGVMRKKQLKELTDIDNSIHRQRQSQNLLYRKASRQTFRGLREAIGHQVDFFSCEASELATAKTFLRKREIESKFAGVWGNGIFVENTEEDEEDVSEPFGLDGGPGAASNPTFSEAPIAQVSRRSESSYAIKEAFVNWIGDSPTSISLFDPQRNCRPAGTVRSNLNPCKEKITSKEHSKVGKKKQQGTVHGRRDQCSTSVCLSVPTHWLHEYSELALTPKQQQQSAAARSSSDCDHDSKALMRDLFGFHERIEPSNGDPPSECAENLIPNNTRESTETKQDTRKQGIGEDNAIQRAEDYISGPVNTQVSNPCSGTTTPAHRTTPTRPKSTPDIGLFQDSGFASPRTATGHPTPPTSIYGDTTTEDEDEMVLLPTCMRR
ncbi:hypothetical protein BDV18DRAFT_157097 [Aspergillus unguis]